MSATPRRRLAETAKAEAEPKLSALSGAALWE